MGGFRPTEDFKRPPGRPPISGRRTLKGWLGFANRWYGGNQEAASEPPVHVVVVGNEQDDAALLYGWSRLNTAGPGEFGAQGLEALQPVWLEYAVVSRIGSNQQPGFAVGPRPVGAVTLTGNASSLWLRSPPGVDAPGVRPWAWNQAATLPGTFTLWSGADRSTVEYAFRRGSRPGLLVEPPNSFYVYVPSNLADDFRLALLFRLA